MRELTDFNQKNNHNAWDNTKLPPTKLLEAKEKVLNDIKTISSLTNTELNNLSVTEINNKAWETFYTQHTKNFFRDRKWLIKHFPSLCEAKSVFELGCGAGNSLAVLYDLNKGIELSGCDFSETSVRFCSERIQGKGMNFFEFDITRPMTCWNKKHDACLLIFTLSAIHPNKHQEVINNVKQVLKSGGLLYFNDYGLYDMIQLRYKSESIIAEHFYKRTDGTYTYFFDINLFKEFMERNNFEVVELKEVSQLLVNRKRNVDMYRVFIRGIFKMK